MRNITKVSVLQGQNVTRPSATCEKCNRVYAACDQCGASPLSMKWVGTPHAEITGGTCSGMVVRRTLNVCCRRYGHHLGSTCGHCGQKD